MIDEEVRKLIDGAYEHTKKLLREKKDKVEKLAEALLFKEVLFQSDVENLIGKRPYEEKKPADVVHDNPPLYPAHPLDGNGAGTLNPVPDEVQ
jgi:AFG3 family protein